MESLLLNRLSLPHNPSPVSIGERIWRAHKVHFAGSNKLQAKNSTLNLPCKYSADNHHNNTQSTLKFQGRNNKSCLVYAASQPRSKSELGAENHDNTWNSVLNVVNTFYRSIRPYAIIGTAVSVTTTSLLAVEKFSDINTVFFMGLMQAIVPAVLMNIYMVFINNLTDVDIDKVNKPYLAIASGEFSFATGVMITVLICAMSLCIGWISGSKPLLWALFICFVLGTGYSVNLPLLRWKRNPFTAQMTWLCYQAVLSIAYFLHMQTHVLGKPALFPRSVKFAATIFSVFSIVLISFKDIPDIDGDRKFGIDSFAIRLGQKRVFWLCMSLLEMAYVGAILVGLMSPYLWSKVIMVSGHGVIAAILWAQAKSVDLKNKAAITSFYMFLWKLFYTEHLLIPFVR